MPKSKSKQQPSQKQKKLITGRLMEISMKIDDYVYKHKAITEVDAKLYAKEVEGYRASCINDQRSLQVIEKLTRYMNTIIAEYQASKENTHEYTGSVSPVYSMCDEDLTQFTQTETPNVIDLTEDDNINKNIEIIACNERNVDVEIQKASKQISNLSLKENDLDPTVATTGDSLDILENFRDKTRNEDPIKSISINQHVDEQNKAFFNNPLKVTKIPYIINSNMKAELYKDTIQNDCVNLNISKNTETCIPADILNKEDTRRTNDSPSIINNYNSEINVSNKRTSANADCSQSLLINYEDNNNLDKNLNIPKAAIDNLMVINNLNTATKQPKEPAHKNTLELAKPKDNPQNKSQIDKKRQSSLNVSNKQKAPRNQKIQVIANTKLSIDTNITESQTNYTVNNTGNKQANIPPIYKRTTENDLSWLEGIRFVREVRQEEHVTLEQLKETFWDNFCLPPDWNESEYF